MLDENYVTFEIGKTKHIALVAHDGKKKELVDWCEKNKEILKSHFLCGTGTTSRLIAERNSLLLFQQILRTWRSVHFSTCSTRAN